MPDQDQAVAVDTAAPAAVDTATPPAAVDSVTPPAAVDSADPVATVTTDAAPPAATVTTDVAPPIADTVVATTSDQPAPVASSDPSVVVPADTGPQGTDGTGGADGAMAVGTADTVPADAPREPVVHAVELNIIVTADEDDHLSKLFDYHKPSDDLQENFTRLRHIAKLHAAVILRCCPPTRERSLALTKVEEAMMWGNAAVARHAGG